MSERLVRWVIDWWGEWSIDEVIDWWGEFSIGEVSDRLMRWVIDWWGEWSIDEVSDRLVRVIDWWGEWSIGEVSERFITFSRFSDPPSAWLKEIKREVLFYARYFFTQGLVFSPGFRPNMFPHVGSLKRTKGPLPLGERLLRKNPKTRWIFSSLGTKFVFISPCALAWHEGQAFFSWPDTSSMRALNKTFYLLHRRLQKRYGFAQNAPRPGFWGWRPVLGCFRAQSGWTWVSGSATNHFLNGLGPRQKSDRGGHRTIKTVLHHPKGKVPSGFIPKLKIHEVL